MNSCKLIPVPKNYTGKEKIRKMEPHIQCTVASWMPLVEAFIENAQKIYGIAFTEGKGGIQVVADENIKRESYVLDIQEEVVIQASDPQGCAYALASVLQLMNGALEIEEARVEDEPDKDYRGLMIDLAREWHPFAALLHYIDLCFFYKVKYLHLHFMDDQSYTLPSHVFPKLPTQGRFYSEEEIKKLCSYAKSRGVVLVPEIEMPGHAKTLIRAYPDLFANHFDMESEIDPASESGLHLSRESVVCAGSEKAWVHVTELIDEVLELFPGSPYIHLGADEVNTKAWESCPVCREYMEQNQIKDVQGLYGNFVARATDYVLSKGKRPIVWEGFSKEYSHKISKEVIAIAWESHYQNADDLLEAGFDVINCSWQPLYIVPNRFMGSKAWNEMDILKWNVYEWQHWWEHSSATLNPIHVAPTRQVLGAQLCVWETTYECEIADAVVRLAALSERTWSVKRHCSNEEFRKKLQVQMIKAFRMIAEK